METNPGILFENLTWNIGTGLAIDLFNYNYMIAKYPLLEETELVRPIPYF
jgi:hypothetical protein